MARGMFFVFYASSKESAEMKGLYHGLVFRSRLLHH